MLPTELTDIAAGYVSIDTDEEGNKTISISTGELSLSPLHGQQFDELVTKLAPPEKPIVKRLSKKGAIKVKATDLVAVLEACNKQNIQLDDPT